MTEQEFYSQPSRSLEEWSDYISSEHYYRNPDVTSYSGNVAAFFFNPNLQGFWLILNDDDKSRVCVSTRYMTREKYLAIERYARMAVDLNVPLCVEGVLGYDMIGAQITNIERVWLDDNSTRVFRLQKIEAIHG